MRRFAVGFAIVILAAVTVSARTNAPLAAAETTDIEQALFASGGVLEVDHSFGDMEISGWDHSEIQVVVTKTTQKRYAPQELDRAAAELDRILVTTEQVTNDHLVIHTEFPSRNAHRLLRGKSNAHLSYRIYVPRQTRLVVKHDMGELKIHDVAAGMLLSNRVGDIDLSLPENERYAIDAKSRVGGVNSEWCSEAYPATDDGTAPHFLQLRVGIGMINVHKSHATFDTLVD